MADEQPEALILADLCETGALINAEWDDVATELRRLHAVELEAIALRAQVVACALCGEAEAFGGTCGGGRDNPKALCFQAPAQEAADTGADALSLDEFKHWLNDRRMSDVSYVFHEIVAHYRAALAVSTGANVDAGMVPQEAEWIVWPGGERPVAHEARVEIMMRDGVQAEGDAGRMNWRREGSPFDIAAYRSIHGLTVGGIQASGRVGK